MPDRSKIVMIIIRSIGERTEAVCHALACAQVPEENIVIVRERPFGAAVRKTFRLGIERGLPWTLAVDADVLLRSNAVDDLIGWAAKQPDNLFFVNPTVADKLLGQIRPAGVHLYRTTLIEKALKHTDDIDTHARPESLVYARMAMTGFTSLQLQGMVVGLHDFEQSYRDIYRTAYVHALKHPPALMEPCIAAWQRQADDDPDFRVALLGSKTAEKTGGKALIDDRVFPKSISEIPELSGIGEKPPLTTNSLSSFEISKRLGAFSPFPESLVTTDLIGYARKMLGDKHPTLHERIRVGIDEVGYLRFPILACGAVLQNIGKHLIQVVK